MTSMLRKDNDSLLKKRNISNLSVKINTIPYQTAERSDVQRKTADLVTKNESFFDSVWPVIAVAQCMGFMPINDVRTGKPSQFKFHWKTMRMAMTMLYVLLGGFIILMYLKHITLNGISAKNTVGLVFFSCCVFAGILFLFLARKWKDIAIQWAELERAFLNPPYEEYSWRLSTKLRITAVVVLILALSEHIMSLVSGIHNYIMRINICKINVDDHWRQYFLGENRHVFQFLPYNFLLTVIIEFVNISCTFGWNYMDTFIMCISIGLSTRFKQINQRLEAMNDKPIDEPTWAEIRHHYVQLCELVELIDKHLSPIILLSCTNNLYFICFQLLNIFNKLPLLINYVYFWYSLLYLIGRTIAVFLIVSSINDAAKYPVKFVRQRKTSEWCTELERFGDQIITEVVALSGMKFFFITRSLIFGMAGTIVTYELVLLQIDEGTKNKGNVSLCG